ncbi:endolytic transglycosylase MltG [Ornithinimicrobium cryptoxanthini]|uniref:Endolytic murein transglycosylase n=1 Tax=Ornithinimicrobium cryptoxanthini TaxID=2934161 RepID=A0ABY4YEI5_9MICO|nr:endolytic transglycosylase MltG [Ornithinimicrobium cryptoxanthini]USQ74989.1 endolytic transglycosylase MltG [Ornithinimicrobium cryptoxanthini]
MSRPPADDSAHAPRQSDWQDAEHGDDLHDDEFLDEFHDDFDYHDQTLADDVLAPASADGEQMLRPRRRRRKHNPLVRFGAIAVAALVVVVGGIMGFNAVRGMIPDISLGTAAPEDFEGSGSGEVLVDIPPGAGGGQIGTILFDAGVVASAEAFSNTAAADPRSTGIQPGTYTMAEQMSSGAALDRLVDPDSRQTTGVTIREGLWKDEVFAVLADATGHEVADYEAVDPASLDLPEAANGELEGYLFPDTYEFSPSSTPEEQLQAMIDLGAVRYEELGLSDADLHDIIIKASIVQGEGMFAEDLPKVARVVENRLAGDSETNGHLQMDSTIHFIYRERGRAGTTDEQRANPSPYNTYEHPGLPPGPINSPGAAAIDAAMNPAEGDWLYFVTVNPSTGETVFTNTLEEHNKNVEQFLQWCEDNPDSC